MEEQRVGARFLAHNTLRGRGAGWNSGMGLGRMKNINHSQRFAQNQTTSWLVHSLSTFGARVNTGKFILTRLTTTWTWGGSHHLPPYNILYASPQGPHPNGNFSEIPKWEFQNCQN